MDACQGIDAVISTASSTLSRQQGDSIETVDAEGQLTLVKAAKDSGVERFVFVSFRRAADLSFPLAEAKQQIERAIASMNFTVVQSSFFMEVWLSPPLGFDFVNGTARIYGLGTNAISWISFRDVAEFCAVALRAQTAERRTIELGGPDALSPIEVVKLFEKRLGKPFALEHISEDALLAEFAAAIDPLQKSFAALMLGSAHGDEIAMDTADLLGIKRTSVAEYATSVLATA
jgi:uncharacterized protein YbjT (DUF2867 family)